MKADLRPWRHDREPVLEPDLSLAQKAALAAMMLAVVACLVMWFGTAFYLAFGGGHV